MTSTESTQELAYRKYKAPKANGSKLVEPTIASALGQLPGGRFATDSPESGLLEFCGKSFEQTRMDARREIVYMSHRYTSELLELLSLNAPEQLHAEAAARPLIMSGHQPELFHPGVWFKNFVLGSAQELTIPSAHGGTATQTAVDADTTTPLTINFIVDNDTCRSPSIQVPVRSPDGTITAQDVAFDSPADEVPWEMRGIVDETVFQGFCKRIVSALPEEIESPTIRHYWPQVRKAVEAGLPLGRAIAGARLAIEWQAGIHNFEIPLSEIAQSRSFARFSIQLLSQLPRFQQVYNDRLLAYRKAHKIRNHAHPVPALEEVGDWLEAPFWIYRDDASERKRLWARNSGDVLELSDLEGWQATIEGRLDCDNASEQWLSLANKGVRLRPRALTTTMFTRVFVSDVFVHGIGGAKYDQLTDTIIADFYGIDAPPVCVATATMHLPLEGNTADAETRVEQQKQKVWQLQHNPETHFPEHEEMRELSERKKALLANVPPHGEKWQWHIDLKAVKSQMDSIAGPKLAEAKQTLKELEHELRQQLTLGSREYSFCLFPFEETIQKLKSLATDDGYAAVN